MAQDIQNLVQDKGFLFKLIAWILTMVGLIVMETGHVSSSQTGTLAIICFHGHFLILFVVLVSYIMDEKSELMNKLFCGIGGGLHLIQGILFMMAIDNTSGNMKINTLLCGIVALVIGVLLIVDLVLALMNK